MYLNMRRFFQRRILSGYRRIVSLLSPSLTGGLLNFVMEPVNLTESNEKALRIVEFNMSRLPEYVEDLVLKSKLPTTISSSINATGSTQGLKRTAYREMIFASAVAVVLAIVAFLVLIYYPFFRFRKIEKKLLRKKSKGKYKPTTPRRSNIPPFFKGWYIAFGITGLVMMVLLALGIAGLAVSTDSFEFTLRPDVANPNLGDTSILSTIDMIPGEVNLFFDELDKRGKEMDDILSKAVITKLVTTVKNNMMKESRLQELIDLRPSLKRTLIQLKEDSQDVQKAINELTNYVEDFKVKHSVNVVLLRARLYGICFRIREEGCSQVKADRLKIEFNAKIEVKGLIDLLEKLGNMTPDVMESFDKLDNLIKELDETLQKAVAKFEFRDLKSLKNLLTSAYSYKDKVNSQLRKAQTVLKAMIPHLRRFFTIFGYSIVFSLLILLVLSLVQYVFCVKQGIIMIMSDHPTAEPTTRHPPSKSISIIITLVAMYAPTVLLLSAALSIVTTLIANEGCRYIDDDDALRITDMAVNLAIKYRWADWLKTKLPNLKLPQPEFVLRYLIKDCRTLLDLRGPVDKSVRKSIEESGDTIIGKITRMDISKNLPTGLDDLLKCMNDISIMKDGDLIKKFEELEKTKTQVKAYLTETLTFARERTTYHIIGHYAELIVNLVEQWIAFMDETSNIFKMAKDAFNGFDPTKEKYELIKEAIEVLNNIKLVFGSEERVRTVVKSSITEIEDNIQIISEAFAKDIIPCHRLRKITNAAIDALCRDQGILIVLGAYFFFLGAVLFHLIFTILLTRIYFSAHGFLHLWLLL